jgi:hypothetical protein
MTNLKSTIDNLCHRYRKPVLSIVEWIENNMVPAFPFCLPYSLYTKYYRLNTILLGIILNSLSKIKDFLKKTP